MLPNRNVLIPPSFKDLLTTVSRLQEILDCNEKQRENSRLSFLLCLYCCLTITTDLTMSVENVIGFHTCIIFVYHVDLVICLAINS